VPKAKNVRQYLERIITIAKAGLAANDNAGVGLAKRRLAFSYLNNKDAVKRLFNDVAPTCTERPGGYTRIVRCGVRQGDGAPMCYIELVDSPNVKAGDAAAEAAAEEKPKATRRKTTKAKAETSEAPSASAE